jgi:ABC-type lipoprotein release transport system permease subunit
MLETKTIAPCVSRRSISSAAGYWPARSASNLLVVDALRAE